jgi:hypothetical protein
MIYMFAYAVAFDQTLCAWGCKLPAGVDTTDMFLSSNSCPDQDNPSIDSTPPGPFCYLCTSSCPTSAPTSAPTSGPTSRPTSRPTSGPTSSPTSGPTSGPTSSSLPTSAPVGYDSATAAALVADTINRLRGTGVQGVFAAAPAGFQFPFN